MLPFNIASNSFLNGFLLVIFIINVFNSFLYGSNIASFLDPDLVSDKLESFILDLLVFFSDYYFELFLLLESINEPLLLLFFETILFVELSRLITVLFDSKIGVIGSGSFILLSYLSFICCIFELKLSNLILKSDRFDSEFNSL